jgi:hypothetical protein
MFGLERTVLAFRGGDVNSSREMICVFMNELSLVQALKMHSTLLESINNTRGEKRVSELVRRDKNNNVPSPSFSIEVIVS